MSLKVRSLESNKQAGFTLIELMIATIIFTVVLVIVIYAFMFVSNDYIKGNIEAQTQETARAVIEAVSEDIQLNNASYSPVRTASGFNIICIGNHRYSFQYNKELNGSGVNMADHDFVVDTVSGCSTQSPQNLASTGTLAGTELLGNHMRVGNFTVLESATVPGQYTVSVTVGYGSDQTQSGPLKYTVNTATSPHSYTYTCPDLDLGGNFCATATLTVVVQQRVMDRTGS